MCDYEAIREAIFHYCEFYRYKDRQRLERAFALDVANMMGYTKIKCRVRIGLSLSVAQGDSIW